MFNKVFNPVKNFFIKVFNNFRDFINSHRVKFQANKVAPLDIANKTEELGSANFLSTETNLSLSSKKNSNRNKNITLPADIQKTPSSFSAKHAISQTSSYESRIYVDPKTHDFQSNDSEFRINKMQIEPQPRQSSNAEFVSKSGPARLKIGTMSELKERRAIIGSLLQKN